jgi:hypothetical protein
MNDADFIPEFERCALPENSFRHADHIRLAWLYLRDLPLLEALSRFTSGLRRYAASLGKASRYHETITWAYLLLIHERMRRDPDASWIEFAGRNADLLAWRPSILDAYYRSGTLESELARSTFVLPDRLEVTSCGCPSAAGDCGPAGSRPGS